MNNPPSSYRQQTAQQSQLFGSIDNRRTSKLQNPQATITNNEKSFLAHENDGNQQQYMETWQNYRDNLRRKIGQAQGTILIEDQMDYCSVGATSDQINKRSSYKGREFSAISKKDQIPSVVADYKTVQPKGETYQRNKTPLSDARTAVGNGASSQTLLSQCNKQVRFNQEKQPDSNSKQKHSLNTLSQTFSVKNLNQIKENIKSQHEQEQQQHQQQQKNQPPTHIETLFKKYLGSPRSSQSQQQQQQQQPYISINTQKQQNQQQNNVLLSPLLATNLNENKFQNFKINQQPSSNQQQIQEEFSTSSVTSCQQMNNVNSFPNLSLNNIRENIYQKYSKNLAIQDQEYSSIKSKDANDNQQQVYSPLKNTLSPGVVSNQYQQSKYQTNDLSTISHNNNIHNYQANKESYLDKTPNQNNTSSYLFSDQNREKSIIKQTKSPFRAGGKQEDGIGSNTRIQDQRNSISNDNTPLKSTSIINSSSSNNGLLMTKNLREELENYKRDIQRFQADSERQQKQQNVTNNELDSTKILKFRDQNSQMKKGNSGSSQGETSYFVQAFEKSAMKEPVSNGVGTKLFNNLNQNENLNNTQVQNISIQNLNQKEPFSQIQTNFQQQQQQLPTFASQQQQSNEIGREQIQKVDQYVKAILIKCQLSQKKEDVIQQLPSGINKDLQKLYQSLTELMKIEGVNAGGTSFVTGNERRQKGSDIDKMLQKNNNENLFVKKSHRQEEEIYRGGNNHINQHLFQKENRSYSFKKLL